MKAKQGKEAQHGPAAIAGALAGLWYGEAQIPKEWKEKTVKYSEIQKRVEEFYHVCGKTNY